VVKARAYGHSLRAALAGLGQTDGFALLDLDDARWLRAQGWDKRILLLEGLFNEADLGAVIELRCDLVVHCDEQVSWLEKQSSPITVFLKLNSGMNRLGFTPDAYRLAYHRLYAQGHHVQHMTHFANADCIDREPSVGAQMECFTKTIEGLKGETSLANSAAILWHRNALGDWVRPGIMLHGISPTGMYQDIEHAHLKTVMSLSSKIISIQELQAGDAVGYGARYVAKQAMRVGVIACGYADGYPRHAKDGTPVWVYGPMHKRLDMSWFARLRRAYPLKLFSDPELPPLTFFLNAYPSLKDLAIRKIEFKDTHCVRAQIVHAKRLIRLN